MKYARQFLIILLISLFGEILKSLIPLPIPASIYGLVLLFLALELHIIKLSAVQETGKFLIEIMPLMFVSAGAGLIDSWVALKPIVIPILIITVISTIFVMVVSGKVTQFMMRGQKGEKE